MARATYIDGMSPVGGPLPVPEPHSVRLSPASRALDVLIVASAVAAGFIVTMRTDPSRPDGVALVAEVAAVLLVVLTMLLRRRAAFAAPAATWVLCAGLSFADPGLVVRNTGMSIAGMIAAMLLGNLRSSRQARAGLLLVVVGALIVVRNDPAHSPSSLYFVPALFAMGWLVGFALREHTEETEAAQERAAQAERDRDLAARVAVAEERGRIARELHDVVAHAVSVMVLQVGAVRHRMPAEAAEDREALEGVERAGRTALAEMRRLLDAMRHDDDALELTPHASLRDLGALVDSVRAAGLDVHLHMDGRPPTDLPPALDLSAYRIVQEALTNVLKHAQARRADVNVRYERGQLTLTVRDDGRGAGSGSGRAGVPRGGHGLVGIGERVKIYGGQLTVGPGDGGAGFVLQARLPVHTVGSLDSVGSAGASSRDVGSRPRDEPSDTADSGARRR